MATHSATARIRNEDTRRQGRVSPFKFVVQPGEDAKQVAERELRARFARWLVEYPTIVELTVKALPKPKLGVKLNKQHDYVTLTATFADGVFRFTTSWGGSKVSGDFVGTPGATEVLSVAHQRRLQSGVPLKSVEELATAAQGCTLFSDFVANVRSLRTLAILEAVK